MSIHIPLPWTTPPLTGNDRGHSRYSPFTRVKGQAQYAIRATRPAPIVAANITLHWQIPDRRRRDSDNLFPTLKAVQDALVSEGILPEDSWVTIPAATCRIHPPSTTRRARMWVTLDPVRRYDKDTRT